jgi:hypothetical protein
MKLLDSLIRVFIVVRGVDKRWLREELGALRVKIPLSEGCLDELAQEADAAAWRAASSGERYSIQLRRQLAARATFVQVWTCSDDKIPTDERGQGLVRIARKYALPRPWKLSEPVAVEYRRVRPSYWKWASEMDAGPVPQT